MYYTKLYEQRASERVPFWDALDIAFSPAYTVHVHHTLQIGHNFWVCSQSWSGCGEGWGKGTVLKNIRVSQGQMALDTFTGPV